MTFLRAMTLNLALCLSAMAAPPGPLEVHGGIYANGCAAAELKRLRPLVAQAADSLAPDAAWALVRLLLCGTGPSADAAVMRHAPKRINLVEEDTGSDGPVKTLQDTTTDRLLARREAWHVNVTSQGAGELSLGYMPNEACMQSLLLRHNGQGWLVVALSEACD